MTPKSREYSSITTHLPVWLRNLPQADSPSRYYEFTAFAHDSLENSLSSGLTEAVASFLIEMNNKLDSILGMLSMDELRQAFPIEARCTEVGGAGLSFRSNHPFAEGTYVEVILVLCRIPLRLAGAIGRLSQLSPADFADAGADVGDVTDETFWRLDFTRIREQDLETVVRFVIQEERRIIREKKWA